MATPYLGQLTLVAFNFAPKGFALCNGQLLAVNQNQALFALLGTTFGGNGQTTFALPNLQGRIAISSGSANTLGSTSGSETVILLNSQIPAHTHSLTVSNSTGPQVATVSGNTVGTTTALNYATGTDGSVMDAGTITSVGGGQLHENRSPYLVLNWVIALQGIFPSRN